MSGHRPLVLALATVALLAACAEEETNKAPVIESSSVTCEPGTEMAQGDVLVAGTVAVLDDNLLGVQAAIGGHEAIDLEGTPLPEGENPAKVAQTWSFSLDATARVACGANTVLTFTAYDEKGETAEVTVVAN